MIYSTVRVHFQKFRWQANVFCLTSVSIVSLEPDDAVISRICGRILNRFASWVQPYFGVYTPLEEPRNIYQSRALDAWLTIAQHVFQPALTGRLEYRFREKLSPANRGQRLSRWADFAKNCLPRIGSKELTRFREKYRALERQKNGVQHATAIYPIPRYTQPRYIGSTPCCWNTVAR